MVFPIDNFVGDSPAEEEIWALFKNALSKDSISFHNYFLEAKRPDIILLTPNRGVLIIEIKGFRAKNIKSVPDSTVIKFYNSPPKGSPFNQAIEYRNKLIAMMGQDADIDPAFIAVAVCYPYINHTDFHNKMLNKISMEEMTILEEDLLDEHSLNSKIEKIYDFVYQSMGLQFGQLHFEGDEIKKIAYLFAPDFDKDLPNYEKNEETLSPIRNSKMAYYSKLIVFSEEVDKDYLQSLITEWFEGSKLYLFFQHDDDYEWFSSAVAHELEMRGKSSYKNLNKVKESMPNLVFSRIFTKVDAFTIINGEQHEAYEAFLTVIDSESEFNYQQYKIEHANNTDIIVKAGAGTGKTYSMISRINYLIWKNEYSAEELSQKIVMITFTNDAAREMKDKLIENFFDRYVLTTKVIYLDYMEAVEKMRISTIHSIARLLLKKHAVKLGLGKNFTISGSSYEKRKVIHNALNEYIVSRDDVKTGMPLFQLEKRIESFIDQIENKNVDITTDNKVDFGKEDPVGERIRFIDLIPTIRKAKKQYREKCNDNNQVALSDIILLLDLLTNLIDDSPGAIDYLFIDEFQDTDDVQIKLVAKYKRLFSLKLFVVGDTKQCIYRFRGADDAAFKLLKNEVNTDIKEIELKKNYRTDKLLLKRMNQTFSSWNERGDIEYGEKDTLTGTKTYNTSDNYYKKTYNDEEERDKLIVQEIRKLQELFPKDRIAILVRTNLQILDFKKLCDENNISIETSVGGNLFKIEPALDLLKLLHALKYYNRPQNIYGLYTTSYIAEKLDKVAVDKLEESEKLTYFRDNLPNSLKKWNSYVERLRLEPILKVVRDIIDDAKPWTIFSNKIGGSTEERKASKEYYLRNLDQILEKISISFNSAYLTINSLIEYLEIMILTKQEEEERETFYSDSSARTPICTTVHKAKGLEYEHIILPYCMYDVASTKTKGDVDIIYVDNKVGYLIKGEDYRDAPFVNDYYKLFKQTEFEDRRKEEIRILYVAMTRAIKSLTYFVDNNNNPKTVVGNWKDMLKVGE